MDGKIKYRIGPLQKILMLTIAAIFDLVEFVLAVLAIGLILNRIITIIEYFIYILWFSVNKISFTSPKTLKKLGGSFIAEIIPFLGALPMFTVGVYMTIKSSREEDLDQNKEKKVEISNKKIIRQKQKNNRAADKILRSKIKRG